MKRVSFLLVIAFIAFTAASTFAQGGGKAEPNRIKFAKGKHSATVSNSVIRGEVDTYIVGAKAEQMMTVRVTAIENNAAFTVQGPDGEYLQDAGEEDEARQVTNTLPYNGDYKIIVGGTRGNATYRLTVTIR